MNTFEVEVRAWRVALTWAEMLVVWHEERQPEMWPSAGLDDLMREVTVLLGYAVQAHLAEQLDPSTITEPDDLGVLAVRDIAARLADHDTAGALVMRDDLGPAWTMSPGYGVTGAVRGSVGNPENPNGNELMVQARRVLDWCLEREPADQPLVLAQLLTARRTQLSHDTLIKEAKTVFGTGLGT